MTRPFMEQVNIVAVCFQAQTYVDSAQALGAGNVL
jgi:hypothetical protein